MIQGLYQERPPLPFVVGTEMAGVVTAVGEGVSQFAAGDRVVAACGRTLAERVAAKASLVLPAPRGLDFEAAAGICITYFTTMHALKQRAQLQAGETAAGARGRRRRGHHGRRTRQADGRDGHRRREQRREARARAQARRRPPDQLRDAGPARARQGNHRGQGVDVVYDPVGGTLAEPALRSMAWKGRYLVIGFAGGDIPRIPLNLPLLKGCSIVGVFWGSFAQRERDAAATERRRTLADVRGGPAVARGRRDPRARRLCRGVRSAGRAVGPRARSCSCPDQGSPIASSSACTASQRSSAARAAARPRAQRRVAACTSAGAAAA